MEKLSLMVLQSEAFEEEFVDRVPKMLYETLEEFDLRILSRKKIRMTEFLVRSFQPCMNEPSEYGEKWKKDVLEEIKNAKHNAEVFLIEGEDAIRKCLSIKRQIRGRFIDHADNVSKITRNFIHSVDDEEDLILNMKVLFPTTLKFLNKRMQRRNNVISGIKGLRKIN